MNRSGKRRCPYYVLDFMWKAFSLSSLSMVLALDFFIDARFIKLRKFPYIPGFIRVFVMIVC